MEFIEYTPGKFVNLKYIVHVSVHSGEDRTPRPRARMPHQLAERSASFNSVKVQIKIEGEAASVEIAADCVPRFVQCFPELGKSIQKLETALFKAQVISTLYRFPLAA